MTVIQPSFGPGVCFRVVGVWCDVAMAQWHGPRGRVVVVCDVATVRARDVSRALLLVPPFGYIRNPMINSSKYKRQRIIKKKHSPRAQTTRYASFGPDIVVVASL